MKNRRAMEMCFDAIGKALHRTGSFRFTKPVILVFVVSGLVGCASARVADGPPLQLHRGEFTYNNPAKQPIWDWFAMDQAFVTVLERHPSSLEEARKAAPYHTAAWITVGGSAVFSILAIIDAANSSSDSFSSNDYDQVTKNLTIGLGFAAGAWLFESLGQRYINRAVSLFNTAEMGLSGEKAGAQMLFRSIVGNLEVSPAYLPGGGAALVAGSRFSIR